MMYDELIKRLRETSIDFGESDHVSVMLIEAADAIEELWKLFQSAEKDNAKLTAWYVEKCNKHKWIPVTERLPEESGHYLVCYRSGKYVSWIQIDYWLNDRFLGGDHEKQVTHWMALPEPPKDGE